TRSRPYNSNDNAHIEQKNWTNIRQYLGYLRFDNPAIVPLLNDLYANELSLLVNFFLPSFKLVEKRRDGAHIIKRHDPPKTPCDRLLPHLPTVKQRHLLQLRHSLNPFDLLLAVKRKVAAILALASPR
ncbi:MAG TPA: integrase, partial [Candidatus Paceibacterota bacterium]|nr:integrase [Candidatus Paceibacterota bacterium]